MPKQPGQRNVHRSFEARSRFPSKKSRYKATDALGFFRSSGTVTCLPYFLELKAKALYLAERAAEALDAIKRGESLAERYEQHTVLSGLHRLRAVFLAAMGAEETQIEDSFRAAIRIAKEQKAVSLQKRAEATYAEYRRQKASGLGGRGYRLPL